MRKISQILTEKRIEKELSLDTVSKETKIKIEFLEAIEQGDFKRLPSESYALGFVKIYARFLGIPLKLAVPLFRREYELKHNVSIVPEFRRYQHKFNKKLFFNTKSILVISVFLIVALYVIFQYSSLIFPPKLEVETPKDGVEISGNVIEIKGKTDPYATVTVEGEEVYVSLSGAFTKSIYGFSGENTIEIVAKSRFGKTKEEVIKVNVK